MQHCVFRAPIESLDAYADVFGIRLGILNEDIEIAVVIENARIEQLELRTLSGAAAVFFHQMGIRELSLRVFVKHPHVAVRGSVVEVEIIFFYVFAVIALGRTQPEHSLFQDRIAPVPKRERKDQKLVPIANPGDSIFAPAIGFAARQIVR